MFEVIFRWNACRPNLHGDDFISKIKLRGYNDIDISLTGQFINQLNDEKIKPLSVGNIASKICPTRRDLFLEKSSQRVRANERETWGRKVGKFVEGYYYDIFPRYKNGHKEKYSFIKKVADRYSHHYFKSKQNAIDKLITLESEGSKNEGDTDWLLKVLKQNGRANLALKILNRYMKRYFSMDSANFEIEKELNPNLFVTGINNSTPDFIVAKHGLIGDIKTGREFKTTFPLTCAGYALAYENQFKKDINWGVIYFNPTHTSSEYIRIMTYPQVHFFPIDERLRQWFLEFRDEAYDIISKDNIPSFPPKTDECPFCKFKTHCEKQGLVINS